MVESCDACQAKSRLVFSCVAFAITVYVPVVGCEAEGTLFPDNETISRDNWDTMDECDISFFF